MSSLAAKIHVTVQQFEDQEFCSLEGKLVNRPKRVEFWSGDGAEVTGCTDPENDFEGWPLFVRQASYVATVHSKVARQSENTESFSKNSDANIL